MSSTTNTRKPKRYVLGTHPKLKVTATDLDGVTFIPSEARLSVKAPTGTITTYSGADMTTASGYLYIIYNPETTGWYEYEGWVKDGIFEDAATRGFEIYDRVYAD